MFVIHLNSRSRGLLQTELNEYAAMYLDVLTSVGTYCNTPSEGQDSKESMGKMTVIPNFKICQQDKAKGRKCGSVP